MAFDGLGEQFYRDKAEECRAMAALCHFPQLRAQLDKIGDQFDYLADTYERRHLRAERAEMELGATSRNRATDRPLP